MKTVFNQVYTVKGKTVADFRKLWGIQNEYEKKVRNNHIHHCIDAITIACMTKESYEELAKAYHDWEEENRMDSRDMPPFDLPWKNFVTDIKNMENQLLVSHYTPDNLPKKTRKVLKVRGRIQYNKAGKPIVEQGDAVRGALHKETSYGAIKRPVLNQKTGEVEEKLLYVVRKPLDALTTADIKNIVDDPIRIIIEEGKTEEAQIKKELDKAEKQLRDAEEQEEITNAQILVDNLKDQLSHLYAIPNKDGSFTPIRKVRCIAPTVTNPLHIKKHRDQSNKDYKQCSHFANDGNYAMAIYEGLDKKGNLKRDFLVVNNLDAGKHFNEKEKKADSLIPDIHPKSKGLFKNWLKTGTMVLFLENNQEEIEKITNEQMTKRLYKLVKFDRSGRLFFRPHIEARPASELKEEYYVDVNRHIEQLCVGARKFNALIEGYDFKLSTTGKLTWLS